MTHARGFTLIEMVVTLALVGVLALVALPVFELASIRAKESELKLALRQIRTALDNYKAAADSGQIAKAVGESGYPPSLEILVTGVENKKDPKLAPLVFLRHVPRDPLHADPATPAAQTWAIRSYGGSFGDSGFGADVFDIATRSDRTGLNGIPYKEW